ncbi:MAG: hypothetical protein ABSA11_09475 [Candidatus Bathyarchaeia archaeon]
MNIGVIIEARAQTHFDCREASTVDQAKELIAKGYEYVTEVDGVRLFRKPDQL